jgi:hypothetical protein
MKSGTTDACRPITGKNHGSKCFHLYLVLRNKMNTLRGKLKDFISFKARIRTKIG